MKRPEFTRTDIFIFVILASLLVLIMAMMLFKPDMPAGVLGVFTTVAGGILAKIGDIIHHRFGSSQGSKDKDVTIANLKRELDH